MAKTQSKGRSKKASPKNKPARKIQAEKTEEPTNEKTVMVSELQLIVPPDIKTVWADRMLVSLREDNTATLVFETAIPEIKARMQAARIQVARKHLHGIIDVLCRTTGHYPSPDKKEEEVQAKDG
ncbi:MAG: hypothetical protein GC159_21585 [Phycisphaera sp.]|nr:hypothetical protein [Phycisphaera sp.]